MQTFLPYPDFARSVSCLDRQRLGKQRIECKQILAALDCEIKNGLLMRIDRMSPIAHVGWRNHPATKMWRGYELALAEYQLFCILEWKYRGYQNNMEHLKIENARLYRRPPWLGDEAFHASHRSNLLRKDPEWYGQFGWTESPDLEYVWPVA